MPADVFDGQRRAWIAAHAGIFVFQKRRAELLAKKIRAQTRSHVGARPDPHDDTVAPPLPLRSTTTPSGSLEATLVLGCAAIAPLGWPLGKLAYLLIVNLIPDRLRAYPIPALIWGSAAAALPLPFYDPSQSLWGELIAPWLLAQPSATLATAALYGILEGWLAIEGSSDWWPLTPEAIDVDDDLILGPTLPMTTVLDPPPQPSPTRRIPPSLHARRRTPPPIRWAPILIGTAILATLASWCAICAINTLLGPSDQHFDPVTAQTCALKTTACNGDPALTRTPHRDR
ncbi:hypothetical protein KXD96_27350 [Mycobacterium sp. SMC-2]|uniref:hypothetical protein n=1 Tax=Mycobacterium TaxID=1763 RepID=UPI001CE0912F|nr:MULTISPECIES: hypothetical protein [Mycobacterium]MCA4761166.1 hypothetical protein [Mycobacterium avium subsp. hominissuis]UXA06500.1 hypothetical protein KXD96_27350 [Mycobacterium sp. SMC-2]